MNKIIILPAQLSKNMTTELKAHQSSSSSSGTFMLSALIQWKMMLAISSEPRSAFASENFMNKINNTLIKILIGK